MLHLPLALSLVLPQQSTQGLRQFIPPVPTPASFISDARHVLTDSAHAALDARIRGLQAGGFGDIAVAILPDIGDFSPNDIAVAIYRDWKVGSVAPIGSARRDVGVLILIVPKELAPNKKGQCYIAPGTGAEGIVTDAASGTICRDAIIPLLKTRDHAGAVAAGIEAIAARLTNDEGLADTSAAAHLVEPPPPTGWFHWWYIPGGLAAVVAWVVAAIGMRRRRPRTCPRCGRRMHRLGESDDDAFLVPGQVVEEQIKSVDYDVWECDCGEHLVLPYKALFTSYTTCKQCQRRTAKAKRTVLTHATTVSTGRARDAYRCKACEATWEVMVTLPIIVASSGGSGGGGGGGGGGGSSFGGSGSSSGAGGGGSY